MLVLDEADRMIQSGHYPELTHILRAITQQDLEKRKTKKKLAKALAAEQDRRLQQDRKRRKKKGRDEKNDEEAGEEDNDNDEAMRQKRKETSKEELEAMAFEAFARSELEAMKRGEVVSKRQTFVFSATMMLPDQGREGYFHAKRGGKNGWRTLPMIGSQ